MSSACSASLKTGFSYKKRECDFSFRPLPTSMNLLRVSLTILTELFSSFLL